jgi:hypothetical protein
VFAGPRPPSLAAPLVAMLSAAVTTRCSLRGLRAPARVHPCRAAVPNLLPTALPLSRVAVVARSVSPVPRLSRTHAGGHAWSGGRRCRWVSSTPVVAPHLCSWVSRRSCSLPHGELLADPSPPPAQREDAEPRTWRAHKARGRVLARDASSSDI